MKYHIDQLSAKPAYMQLYEQLRRDIVGGIYAYGAKLPSKRLLAEESDLSVITVEHTYAILCDEGYLESRPRSGYFVIYRKSDFNALTGSPLSGSLTAGSGPTGTPTTGSGPRGALTTGSPRGALSAPSLPANSAPIKHTHSTKSDFPFSVLSKTMRRVMLDYEEDILEKSPNRGCDQLRTAICSYLARSNGILVQPEQIIIGAGAEYLYGLIIQLLGKERIFAMESPSYEKIRKVYEANGVVFDMLKLGSDGILTDELERTKASVLHVTPYNSFPSGITANVSKRHEYLDWAGKRNGYIIEDNYDSELTVSTKNEDTIFSLSENGSVIYLNTFSKTIAPSIRVGYMVLPTQLLEAFEKKLGFYSCTVPVFEQYVLAELIDSGDFERHINRVRRARRKSSRN